MLSKGISDLGDYCLKKKKICLLNPINLNRCCCGDLIIYKEIKTNKIFVKCDDCETTYGNIEDALYGKNAIKDTFDERDYATLDEIKEIGYEKHVEEKLFII